MGHRPDRARPPGADPQRHQGDDGLTRQNGVLPTGEIVAHPGRGTLMGNRGILHDASGRLGPARWRHPNWVACRLKFRERRRRIMSPGHYTELFFLDEAVALAAGHRPCAECRRADYIRFLEGWRTATGVRPRAAEIDKSLHAARLVRGTRRQATFRSSARDLPGGVFVEVRGVPHLVMEERLYPFRPGGYGPALELPAGEVEVLTPAPTVAVLRAGYWPEIDASAEALT